MNLKQQLSSLVPTRLVGTVKSVDKRANKAYIVPDDVTKVGRAATFQGAAPELGERVRISAYGDGWQIIGRNLK